MGNEDSLDPLLRRTAIPAGRAAGECLDAETLAAFADGALPPERRGAVESHASECERCLALVAAMVRTKPDPVPDTPRAGWFGWRWVLPLATAAAALLLVIAVQRESNRVAEVPSSTARLEPSPLPPRAAAPVEESRAAEAAPADSSSNKAAALTRGERQQAPPPPASPAAPAGPLMRDEAATGAAASAPAAELTPAVPSTAADSAASGRARGVAATAQRPGDAPARAEVLEEISRSQGRFGFSVPVEVIAPDPAVRWRVVGQVVSRSSDGGVTWREQFTGAGVELLAGAAPSDRVCWLVGRSGVVLRTTDGQTWQPVKSPTTSDLTAVRAVDGETATVTAAGGRQFRTTNGGQTWVPQENSPAPF